MKREKMVLLLVGLVGLALSLPAATNDISSALQKGLFEEEANHDFSSAIAAYQSVVAQYDENRKLAATAVFRLGECYRKRGDTNDAFAEYERILRDFSDQSVLVTLSRQYLTELKASAIREGSASAPEEPVASTSAEAEEVKKIQTMIKDSPDLINAQEHNDANGGGVTPLHSAAGQGHLRVAAFLLANGADVEARIPSFMDRTPLHFAADNGHKAMVELLLSKGAKVQDADSEGNTALHLAAGRGFRSLVEVLLDHGAGVNAANKYGTTPLHMAAANGFRSIVELLLQHGADPNALSRDVQGDPGRHFIGTPLHVAALRDDLALTELLLTNRAAVNSTDSSGQTPLAAAAEKGLVKIAALLVSRGAEVNATNTQAWRLGWTPLHGAVSAGKSEMVTLLLKSGADPNARIHTSSLDNRSYSGLPKNGFTPLLIATAMGSTNIISSLLEFKADPNLKSDAGEIPIFDALNSNLDVRQRALSLLLEHGADANATTEQGTTALMAAASSGIKESVELLLAHKAEVNAQDPHGRSALYYAAYGRENEAEIVELLLAAGADPNLRDKQGRTVLSSEVDRTRPKVAALLRKYGASEDLPRQDWIGVRRAATGYSRDVFFKGTNDWNQFTLLELLAVQYNFLAAASGGESRNRDRPDIMAMNEHGLPFPDLERLRLRRATPDFKGWRERQIDLAAILESGDCSKDVPLEWSDIVEVPETEHALNDSWQGFSSKALRTLQKCLTRQIEIIVKGQSTKITLAPGVEFDAQGYAQNVLTKAPFWIKPVLSASKRLLSSSDLSRVKVTRRDPASGKAREWVLDCSDSKPAPAFWLREGDVIEVPEKP